MIPVNRREGPTGVHTYIHTYVHTYAQLYAAAYVHTYVCMYVCMYVCTSYVRMYMRTYVLNASSLHCEEICHDTGQLFAILFPNQAHFSLKNEQMWE